MASSRIDALMERLSEYVLPLPCDGSSLITGQDLERRRTPAGVCLSSFALFWLSLSQRDGLFTARPFSLLPPVGEASSAGPKGLYCPNLGMINLCDSVAP